MPKDLRYKLTGEPVGVVIGEDVPVTDICVGCDCGKKLEIDLKGWGLEIKGELTFKCPSCGQNICTKSEW